MPKHVALLLDAPMMSWGDSSPSFSLRGTGEQPTLSAMHGLVACCLGISATEDARDFEELGYELSFSSDPLRLSGTPTLMDDHQVSRGTSSLPAWRRHAAVVDTDGKALPEGKLYHKHYLTGVVFGAVLQMKEEVADKVAHALEDPVWPPYLGRKGCVPASPIYQGVFDSVEEATAALQLAASER